MTNGGMVSCVTSDNQWSRPAMDTGVFYFPFRLLLPHFGFIEPACQVETSGDDLDDLIKLRFWQRVLAYHRCAKLIHPLVTLFCISGLEFEIYVRHNELLCLTDKYIITTSIVIKNSFYENNEKILFLV